MNNPLLINVTPFKGLLTETKTGVFEVSAKFTVAGIFPIHSLYKSNNFVPFVKLFSPGTIHVLLSIFSQY